MVISFRSSFRRSAVIFSADSGSSWQRSSAPIRDHLGSLALPIFNRSSSVQGSADRLHFGIFWGRAVRFLVVTADVVLDYLLVFIGFPDRGTWQGSKLRSFGQVPAWVAMSLPRFELALVSLDTTWGHLARAVNV